MLKSGLRNSVPSIPAAAPDPFGAAAFFSKHATQPKTLPSFWLAKITGNQARDRRVNRALRGRGWKVVRVWEHELKRRDETKLVRRLKKYL